MLLPNLGFRKIECKLAGVWLSLVILGNMQIGMRTDTVNSWSFFLWSDKPLECYNKRYSTCAMLCNYLEQNVPTKSNIQGQWWTLACGQIFLGFWS